MELQERFNKLSDLVDRLENIIDDLDVRDMDSYISELMYTIDEAKIEMEGIEPRLRAMRDEEERIEENEYWRMVV